MDQRASLRADQSEVFSCSFLAKSKSPHLWRFAIALQNAMFSCTYKCQTRTYRPCNIRLLHFRRIYSCQLLSKRCKILLEEHGRDLFPFLIGHARLVDHFHLHLVHQLYGRHRHTGSHDLGCRSGRISNGGEGDHGHASLLRYDGEFQRNLRHEAEGAFGAHKEAR